jgi:membrane-associated phospholipid phosphatase
MSEVDIDISGRPAISYSRIGTLTAVARLNIIAWIIVVLVTVVDYVWMQRAGFAAASDALAMATSGPLMLAALILIVYGISCIPRYSNLASRLRVREGCVIGNGLAVTVLFSCAALFLQYLCVSLAPPLIDDKLIALDASLGFHWPDFYAWHIKHTTLNFALGYVYISYTYQLVATVIVLGVARRSDDMADFVLLFMASVVVTIVISTPFPATNPFIHFGIGGPSQAVQWSQFDVLRNGTMKVFDLSKGQGLISMPSLHAADAILFAYAVRHVRWFFPVSLALNGSMIYSAIPFGAHYLVDIIGGALLSAILIVSLRWWHFYLRRQLR